LPTPKEPAGEGVEWKGGWSMEEIRVFLADEEGVTTVEIILVLLVLIALVALFKDQLIKVVKNILNKVSSQSNAI
jgi:Flp pilus assembly pilin Flp